MTYQFFHNYFLLFIPCFYFLNHCAVFFVFRSSNCDSRLSERSPDFQDPELNPRPGYFSRKPHYQLKNKEFSERKTNSGDQREIIYLGL